VFLLFDFVLLDLAFLVFPCAYNSQSYQLFSLFLENSGHCFLAALFFLQSFLFFRPVRTPDSVPWQILVLFFFCSMFFSRRMLVDFVSCAAVQDFLSPASQLVSIRASRSRVFRPPGARPDSDRLTDLTESRLLLSRSV
jgi:hypothetical protein